MRYLVAELQESKRRLTYEVYVTDLLVVASRAKVKARYADLIDETPKETRTEKEIIDSIRAKMEGGNNVST